MNSFRESGPPDGATPAGYAWLIATYGLRIPAPPTLTAIAGQHRPRERGGWSIKPQRYAPDSTFADQVSFALKWEGVNLAVLRALFGAVPETAITEAVRATPTGEQTRRLWFLYEWLTGNVLDLTDAGKVTAVDVVNPRQQFALSRGTLSKRHRVRDNLPGTREFCPLVRRTPLLTALTDSALREKVNAVIGAVHPDVMARAAAFLLLSDSRASFHIEGERPARDRAHRWAQSIASAGTTALSIEAFEALQRLVIGDDRFVRLGLRTRGGFVGMHDRFSQEPLPDHIDARHEDLRSLVNGIVRFDERAGRGAMDAVVSAASIGFGFVYAHPFEDGNGRVHRWLLHHVLSGAGLAPAGVVFPVSSVMLREIASYRKVLESYSRPLLACIDWRPTLDGNVEVLNDTADWYRYFDATAHAEFLYHCVRTTIESDLPYEVAYLRAYDTFAMAIGAMVDMPTRTRDLLHRFLRQNNGRLSQRARGAEFANLTDGEVAVIEAHYAESVSALPPAPAYVDGTVPLREEDT
ncbi:MAG: Fic family protein [Gemmatimonadaceae bacterium]|nr:Fic family protein [Gemmatimonadaceae bacterium]